MIKGNVQWRAPLSFLPLGGEVWSWGGLSLFCNLKSLLVHIGINMLPSLGRIRLIYFSKEREKMKLIEWNEKDRNVDLGPTTTMVLDFSIWLVGGLGDCPQDEWANFTSRFQKKVIEIS
jgi:hypothetical protein